MTNNAAATAAFASENQRIYDSVSEVQTVAVSVIPTRAKMTFYVVGATQSSTFVLQAGSTTFCPDCKNGVYFTSASSTSSIASSLNSWLGCWSYGVTRAGAFAAIMRIYLVFVPIRVFAAFFAAYNGTGGAPGFMWTVTVNCPLAAPPPSLSVSPINFKPLSGFSPDVGNELTVPPSLPLGGSANFWYNSIVGDNSSTPLVVSLSNPGGVASSLSQQLLAQPGVSRVSVVNSAWNCNGASGAAFACDYLAWQITFVRPYGNIPQILADNTGLTGANASATSWTVIDGSTDAFLFPAPMDYFSPAAPVPGITVTTRGILGDCPTFTAGACNFAYVAALTPTVTAINTTAVTVGSGLSITGTGFLPGDLVNNTISIGPLASCAIVSATTTQLVCIIGNSPSGTYPVIVEVLNMFRPGVPVGFATGALNVTIVQSISGISPSSGSQAGGTLLVISGNGFNAFGNDTVTVGGEPCAIQSTTLSSVTCITPANPLSPSETNAVVLVNGLSAPSFQYLNAMTPILTSLSPLALSSAITGKITLQLSGVPVDTPITVAFGARPCKMAPGSVSFVGGVTTVTCSLVRAAPLPLPQAPVPPTVTVGTWGYASDGSFALDTGYRVNSMSVTAGSLLGGTSVTFTG